MHREAKKVLQLRDKMGEKPLRNAEMRNYGEGEGKRGEINGWRKGRGEREREGE